MEKSKVTDYIMKYLEENHISPKRVSLETGIPAEKLRKGYKVPLDSEEFLELCVYLQIRPETVSAAIRSLGIGKYEE